MLSLRSSLCRPASQLLALARPSAATANVRQAGSSAATAQLARRPTAPIQLRRPFTSSPATEEPSRYVQPLPGDDFGLLMVSAGNIMFGSDEGPWNHSFRLEHKLGPRLKVVGLIDPSADRANAALAAKRDSFVVSAYEDTQVFAGIEDYSKAVRAGTVKPPRAAIIGSPPFFRGGPDPGRDLELQLLKNFPSIHLFVEKPVASGEPFQKSIDGAKAVAKVLEGRPENVVSVGYMLRYLACVQQMKKILRDNNLTVMATVARYVSAYEHAAKTDWWTKSMSMGPVIEQGTHFCDLSRYFAGDVDISTVCAHSVEHDEAPGKLTKIPFDESKIPAHDRIPRVTSAAWKYESGAVGQLTHAVALQGQAYSCEFEVYADGYKLRLQDPYGSPTLLVRRPGSDHEEVHRFENDDPFFSEINEFIARIEGEEPETGILSSYLDATKTYELTWAIRNASEQSAARVRAAAAAK